MVKYLEQKIEYVKQCVQKDHTYRQINANFKRQFPQVIIVVFRKKTFVCFMLLFKQNSV